MRRMLSNEERLRWRDGPSTLRYRPHWLPSAPVSRLLPWKVVAVFEAAAAVAKEAAEGALRAPIDSAGAHTRFDAGMLADRGSNRLLTGPQPLSWDISPHKA